MPPKPRSTPVRPAEVTATGRIAIEARSAEQSVRAYLNFLADPSASIDPSRIAQLEQAMHDAADPVERLRHAAALERARTPDGAQLVADFIRDAKAWADAEQIPVSAFRQLGVTDDVLRRAGLVKAARSGGRRRQSERSGQRVTVEDIAAWALGQPDVFTIKDATMALGGSLVTANKALQALVADGTLVSLGPAEDHRGPGRAPARFAVAKRRKPRS